MRRIGILGGWGGWRAGGMLLLALALAVRLAAPSGWMLAPGDGQAPPHLVICTGHGPLDLAVLDHGKPGHPADRSGDHPCVFAGHPTPTPPSPLAALLPAVSFTIVAAPAVRLADQRPGRGLAAPPPPAVGPPTSLV
jgi:hypothetical protein